MELYSLLPAYYHDIVGICQKKGWIVHNFNTECDEELYNSVNYHHNIKLEGSSYSAVFDLNVFQKLVNSVKKSKPKDDYRAAVAFLVFLQLSDIVADPTYAVYEKINYNGDNLNEAIYDLEIFKTLDNMQSDVLAKYALGFSDKVEVVETVSLDKDIYKRNLMEYDRLTSWDSIYLIVLSIVSITFDKKIPDKHKMYKFSEWMVSDFRRSIIGAVYGIVWFGHNDLRNIMKYKESQSITVKRRAVWNMTWDLYFMDRYVNTWIKNKSESECFIVSDDKALRSLMRFSVDVQKKQSLSSMKKYFRSDYEEISRMLLSPSETGIPRVYGTERWDCDYRKKQIEIFEKKLFY